MTRRERALIFARLYSLTKTESDYYLAVELHTSPEFLDEAETAWEAIDQYLGLGEI